MSGTSFYNLPIASEESLGIRCSAEINDILYVGGTFTTMAGKSRNRLAAFDMRTWELTNFNPLSGSSDVFLLTGLTVHAGNLYATTNSGITIPGIGATSGALKISPAGVIDPVWLPTVGGAQCIAAYENQIFIGGSFVQANATPRKFACSLSPTGVGALNAWDPGLGGVGGIVRKIKIINGNLFLLGTFSTSESGAKNRQGIVEVSPTTAATTTFNAQLSGSVPADCEAFDIYYDGNAYQIGGYFTKAGNTQIDTTGLISLDMSNDAQNIHITDGSVQIIDDISGDQFFGGDFFTFDGVPVTGAVLLRNGGISPALGDLSAVSSPSYLIKHSTGFILSSNQQTTWWLYSEPPAPQAPKIFLLLRKNGKTFLKWLPVVFNTELFRMTLLGYRVYRSTSPQLEDYTLVTEVISKDTNGLIDTAFSEEISGFVGYAVSALCVTGESERTYALAVDSTIDKDAQN